ncbi:MAG: ABC transporter ATP-binding protein [bacterium]|nr:ABC transporter ATP-binding protein [bacterium]
MKVSFRDTLAIYWSEMRHHKWLLFFMMVAMISAKILQIIVPLYYKKFFDLLGEAEPTASLAGTLISILVAILVINAVSWLGWRGANFLNSQFQPRMITGLTERAFANMIGHSYGFFANSFVGALTRRCRRLGDAFERFADAVYWILLPLGIRIVSSTIVLWILNPVIAMILIIWMVILLGLNYWFALWKLKYDTTLAARDSEVTAVLSDALTNHTNLLLFGGASGEMKGFRKVNESFRKLMTFTWSLDAAVEATQTLLMVAVEFFLFYFAIRYWIAGTLSIGSFVLIQAYLFGLIGDMWDFGRSVRNMYRSFADAEEMVAIMKTPHEIKDVPGAKPLEVTKGEIVFDKVSFSFHKTRMVLRALNIHIKPGEKIGIVGPSGAGKSTIVKTLFRFYDVEKGKILIDGQSIARVTQESLRRNLSLVPQDTVLFHRTIRENIRYSRPAATDEEVEEAAKLAHCHEFIVDLPQGYDTFVGERGIKLSGGERQRVAIARAILKNAPILVLDEATSSLDSQSEALIQDALEHLMEGKTTIVIAHRLSTIRKMDRILVIGEGQIKEEGTHDRLMRKSKSTYRRLWKLQAGGFLQDEGVS